MAKNSLRVIVVDDDFMIAKVHAKYIELRQDYQVVAICYNYEQSLEKIKQLEPDLLILDVYLPDRSGIELLHTIRLERIHCDVILITAAKELDFIEEGFRLGIFDYLIKPFDFECLENSLIKYSQYRKRLSTTDYINQGVVDDLKRIRSSSYLKQLQAGIDSKTLERIKESLLQIKDFQSAESIAKLTEVSRSTARMYLTYLVEETLVEEKLLYGTVGRPQKVYRLKHNR